ncbi:hypothetical protein Theos_0486 [Thermus oshimai JL-2]|uniref:Uncharacterized protein n=1 Tax=Thermus oshimai JL-2 TaxID=751945 RepID=K7QTZ8_THEOS|nr:hypothetical protein [Thermus oshimai]AFV75551.1 hypothetical protein Theos_0486 [Thermus oshimai JL-2]
MTEDMLDFLRAPHQAQARLLEGLGAGMRKIQPVARRFALDERADDRAEWQALPLEERLGAVWEMAVFWAERELREARARGETPEIALRLLPVARKRPLGGEDF